nr:hypothetical protein [Laribacter hongkongensis]
MAPDWMVMAPVSASVPPPVVSTVPAMTVSPPVAVLAPVSVRVPEPLLASAPAPVKRPL